MEDVDVYGNEDDDDEDEEEEDEDVEEEENSEDQKKAARPVSEMDIIKAKLEKARKAMKVGLIKRKVAVQSNIERR